MGAAARSYDHPRWRYDESSSPAARRSAARMAGRASYAGSAQARVDSVELSQSQARPRHVAGPAERPALRVVQQPRRRFGAIILVVVILGAALLAPVGLNSAMRRSEYRIAQLQQRQDDLIAERSTLRAEHASRTSTQRVKETADRLGMVVPPRMVFIDLTEASDSDAAADGAAASASAGVSGALVVAQASQEADTGR